MHVKYLRQCLACKCYESAAFAFITFSVIVPILVPGARKIKYFVQLEHAISKALHMLSICLQCPPIAFCIGEHLTTLQASAPLTFSFS